MFGSSPYRKNLFQVLSRVLQGTQKGPQIVLPLWVSLLVLAYATCSAEQQGLWCRSWCLPAAPLRKTNRLPKSDLPFECKAGKERGRAGPTGIPLWHVPRERRAWRSSTVQREPPRE